MPMPEPKPSGQTLSLWLSDLKQYFFPSQPISSAPPITLRREAAAPKVAPGVATNLHTTALTSTSVSLAWTAPSVGTKPFSFLVLTRVHGAGAWSCGPSTTFNAAIISGLVPRVSYDFQIMTSNN